VSHPGNEGLREVAVILFFLKREKIMVSDKWLMVEGMKRFSDNRQPPTKTNNLSFTINH
jgi:hypothetical protein